MFQILGMLDKLGAGIFYGIVSGIYSTVAKIYDIMLELIQSPSDMFTINLGNILDTAYVAAGVFMLFRVMVAMIQMFLNPDTVTDSNAGAGKLLTRVVTVIVLLIALKPTGFILGDNGLFRQVENAMLAEDGLITNIINGTNPSFDSSNKNLNKNDYVYAEDNLTDNSNTLNFSGYLYEEVSAANNKLTCYYLGVKSHSQKVEGNNVTHEMTINTVYKIDFYNNNKDGKSGKLNCSGGVCKYSYTVRDGTRVAGKTENGYYSSLGGNVSMGDAFSGSFPRKCPKYLQEKTSGGTHYAAMKKHPIDNSITACKGGVVGTSKKTECKNIGIMGGYSTFDQLRNVVASLQLKTTGVSYSVKSTHPWISKLTSTSKNDEEGGGTKTYLRGIDEDAVKFAQATAGTFMDCSGDTECDNIKNDMFKNSSANAKVIDYVADDTMTLDWFTAAIVGVALIVYLLILCIDVIVRRLKLILMEMISPIPIVGYIDPKDKMFMTWLKMYMSIYADLFIKLIAMAFLVNLLKWDNLTALWGEDSGLLVKFFYIVAILVFAKVVPSMLSKIFGLESNGGSFKDILGMAKGAAGFGAGAVIGGAVGAATGKGLGGVVSGFAKGAMMGAGSGAKGNIFGGARAVAASNKIENAGKDSGLTFFQRKMAAAGASLGIEDPYTKAKDKKEVNDDFISKASKYNDEGLKKVNKLIGKGHGDKFANLVEARNDAQRAQNGEAVALYSERINADGTTSFVNKLTGETKATYNTSDVTSAHRNYWLNTDEFSMTGAEAMDRVVGEEKAASKQLRADIEAGNFDKYGEDLKADSSDVATMLALHAQADSAAKRAGYTSGYNTSMDKRYDTTGNKDLAEQASAAASVEMDKHEAAHMYSQQKK